MITPVLKNLAKKEQAMISNNRLLNVLFSITSALLLAVDIQGFSPTNPATSIRPKWRTPFCSRPVAIKQHLLLNLYSDDNYSANVLYTQEAVEKTKGSVASGLIAIVLATLFTVTPLSPLQPANAYDASDYASDAVETVVKSLKDANGDENQIFRTYENIADIITEGKGVGGIVNYRGVTLERGFVSDEDTSIYNPGLTLLTEGEKNTLVKSIVDSRQTALNKNQWSEKNQLAYEYLKSQLDPYHMTELKGYLRIFPALVGLLYVAVLATQQFARDLFPVAYVGAVVAIFVPAILLVWGAQ